MRLSSKSIKIVALALTVCLTSLSVSAQIAGIEQKNVVATNLPAASGVLNISEGTEIYVNGNRAQDGMTILSGAQVETRERGAVVALSNLGIVSICRETKLNLTFAGNQVEMKLMSGNARLELNVGANGRIAMPNGNLPVDANGLALTSNYNDANCGCKNIVASDVPVAGFPKIFPLLGIGAGAIAAAIIGTSLGDENELPVSISVVVP